MFSTYWLHLKSTLADASPKNNKLVWQLTLIFLALSLSVDISIASMGLSEETTKQIEFFNLILYSVLFAAYYHLLGHVLENKKSHIGLKNLINDNPLIFSRSTGFLFINLMVSMFVLVLVVIIALVVVKGSSHLKGEVDTLETPVLMLTVTVVSIALFLLFWVSWAIFPKWFFKSMPLSYDIKSYDVLQKQNLRRALFPTLLVLFLVNFGSLILSMIILEINNSAYLEYIVSTVSSVFFGLAMAITFTAAARMANLSTGVSDNEVIRNASPEVLDEKIATSKKMESWKLIPYTDGNYAYFPNSRWNKGYVLNDGQARTLFQTISSKGLSFMHVFIIIMAVQVFRIASDYEPEASDWFYIFAGIVFIAFFEILFRAKKFRKAFPDAPVCQHIFPAGYYRLRLLTMRLYSLWALIIQSILMGVFGALVLLFQLTREFDAMPPFVTYTFSALLLLGAAMYVRWTYFHIKFRRIHGRAPKAEDLSPLDPLTGEMSVNPFVR